MDFVFGQVKAFDTGSRHQKIKQHTNNNADDRNGGKHKPCLRPVPAINKDNIERQEEGGPNHEKQNVGHIDNTTD
ncbi:MAG: hypothetical protein BWX80_00367 [Candidatus Hydrogenedentes bacterium ADurb.Bin101]|nr:MAG: hypothetical protein BWX80_00367 [Candidatus Hydrogenedentes bacterium ADurb.Bin101]